ncbi:MAG TPA: PGF-pre-PGF domain-containing protein [Candidatus Nanoarchaeia archaeon]|nr:PGF-pre-PGF domain-containing protein [Candidatus Nanoarchaeia archaeon]
MAEKLRPLLYLMIMILSSGLVIAAYTVTLWTPADNSFVTGSQYLVNVTIDSGIPPDGYSNITNLTVWANSTIVCQNLTIGPANNHFNATNYTCVWDTTATPEGIYFVTANVTNSSDAPDNMYNDTSQTVYVDNTVPFLFLLYPLNNTNYTLANINFTWIVNDTVDINTTCNLTIDSSVNTTGINVENVTPYNLSRDIGDGNHNWSVSCIDNASLTNTSLIFQFNLDNRSPFWANNVTNVSSGSAFNATTGYQFNVTWNDTGTTVARVLIEHNFTGTAANYSVKNVSGVYYYNWDGPIAAGTYYWQQIANDTNNNTNTTPVLEYIVAQASTNTTLLLNGSAANLTVAFRDGFNVTGLTDVINVTLYRNGTIVNASTSTVAYYNDSTLVPGHYNFTAVNFGDANYSGSDDTWWLNITRKNSTVLLLLNGTNSNLTINISEWVNITGVTVAGEGNLSLYENGTLINENSTPLEYSKQYGNLGLVNLTIVHNQTQNYTEDSETWFLNVTDTIPPTPSNPTEFPTDPANYSFGQFFQFNVTWTDNVEVYNVTIEHNFTGAMANYTTSGNQSNVYFYNITNIGAGTYAWRMSSNDTLGNRNATEQYSYTVNQNATNTSLYLNGSQANLSVTFGNGFNVTGVTTAVNVTLYRNGTIVNASTSTMAFYNDSTLVPGHYNFTAVNPGTDNYTSTSATWWLTVAQAASNVTLYLNGSQANLSVTFGNGFNVTGVANMINVTLYRNGTVVNASTSTVAFYNDSTLAVGHYNFTAVNPGNSSYSSSSETWWLTVAQATSSADLYLDGSQANLTVTFGDGFNATGVTNIINVTLYRNGTIVNASTSTIAFYNDSTLAVGHYNFTAVNPGNSSYSSSSETWWLTVTKAASNVTLYLNGNAADLSVTTSTAINMTGVANMINVTLYFDGGAVNSSTSTIAYYTNSTAVAGTYNITAVNPGNSSYSSSSQTRTLTITAAAAAAAAEDDDDDNGGGSGGILYLPDTYDSLFQKKTCSHVWADEIKEGSFSCNEEGFALDEVSVRLWSEKEGFEINVKTIEKPLIPCLEEGAYQYLDITKEGAEDSDVRSVALTFKVERSWLEENNYAEDSIVIIKSDGGDCAEITPEVVGRDNAFVYYQITVSDLSYFAIQVKPKAQEQPVEEAPVEEVVEEVQEAEEVLPAPEKDYTNTIIWILGVLVIISIAGIMIYRLKKK